MAKARRPTARRPTAPTAKKQKPKPAVRSTPAATARAVTPKEPARTETPAAPPPARKPAFYEALAIYETGVRALQRHDFLSAAGNFRDVIQRYPDERELVERARLYLQVCERETARRPELPQTPAESVYAATVALNAGDAGTALDHLNKALEQAPDSDHAHYIMAVALTERGDSTGALTHLRQAIELNPDNRVTAIQDPDLVGLRDLEAFRDALGAAASPLNRRRIRARR
jgi:tetratricopeptide (TPR) repeat protein